MKIGVVSDTHGNIDAWNKAYRQLEGADLILHAGDVLYHPPRLGWIQGYDIPALVDALNNCKTPLVIVRGNCDAQVYEELLKIPVQSDYAVVQFGAIRIVISHGHLFTKQGMADMARRYGANCFVFGHTHIPEIETVDQVLLINPGSPSIPKLEIEGRPIPTVGLITDATVHIINIDDGSLLKEAKVPQ
ncbi:MAG: phosphodiesterase [Armatimonadota bacterium]|nr:phosphodiesterase [Armatimonadota bacterium]